MTDNIAQFPSLANLGNPVFRRMMRRAIRENRQIDKVRVPEGKVIAFRRMADLPRIGKEDPVDANQAP